jgi:hypothetical protein
VRDKRPSLRCYNEISGLCGISSMVERRLAMSLTPDRYRHTALGRVRRPQMLLEMSQAQGATMTSSKRTYADFV